MATRVEALTDVAAAGAAAEGGAGPPALAKAAWPAAGPAGSAGRAERAPRGAADGAAGGAAAGRLGLLEALVREPDAFLATVARADGVALVRALVASVLAGAGVFGAVVGAFRGGAQVAYCAAKVPLVLLGTLVVCTPAFVAVARATGTRMGARDVVALTLGAGARFSLVLAGLAPVVWLLEGWCGYHRMVLLAFAACAAAGAAAAALLFRGLTRRPGAGRVAGVAFVAIFGLVGAQTSWLLRPYVVRPQTRQLPFVRAIEGDLPEALWKSVRSSLGLFDAGPAGDDGADAGAPADAGGRPPSARARGEAE